MNLPFGLQFKSLVVGILFALFVWPWLMRLFSRARSSE